MDTPSDPTLLARGARRFARLLEDDEGTMAWVLARLRERAGVGDAGIAARLGFDEALIPRLALCNRPRSDLFREDVEAIAEHFEIAPRRLADMVREAEGLVRFQPRSERSGGLLAAARERVAEDSADYDGANETAPNQDERRDGRNRNPAGEPQ